MSPVPREGLGTFAVDKRWRMYYDPALCLKWSIDEIAAVWLHEVNHLFREHASRFEERSESHHREWNHAADAAINTDLRESGIVLPDPEVRFYAEPNALYEKWRKGMTTEQMYDLAKESSETDSPDQNTSGSDEQSEEEEDTEDDSGDDSANQDAPESQGEQDSQGEDDSENEEDSQGDEGSEGEQSEQESDEGGGQATSDSLPSPNFDDCGSGASGGQPRDYEEPAGADEDDGSLDGDEADLVRKEMAEDIKEAAQAGKVAGGLAREASEILDPQVDWLTELTATVRRLVANTIGQKDYSYTRPSRRNPTAFVLPSLRAPQPPTIAIVLDTSGSMRPKDLAAALSEMQSIISRFSSRSNKGLRVINCDAKDSEVQVVRRLEDVELIGGGGTDMRVGITQASLLSPKPDIVITITDGGTPWPQEPDSGSISYLAVIVRQEGRRYFHTKPPEWMRAIYIDDYANSGSRWRR